MKTRFEVVHEKCTVLYRGYLVTLDIFDDGERHIEVYDAGLVVNASTMRFVSDRTIADMIKMYERTASYTMQECLDKVLQMQDAPSPDYWDDVKLLGVGILLKLTKKEK